MEKAILKTLIYADIFDYPLRIAEIHKWLVGRKAAVRQVESAIVRLVKSKKLKAMPAGRFVQSEYYFLEDRHGSVVQRKRKEGQSAVYLRKAKLLAQLLKVIPWIKLVGISGGLALNNASKRDDIDLFVITSKNRLWISRLLILTLLSITGQRRKAGEKGRKIAGKLCINTLLEEDCLEQKSKDIYVAHEVLQMKVLWQRDGIYQKFLEDNFWAFKFLPNWVVEARGPVSSIFESSRKQSTSISRRASSLTSFAAATRRDALLAATPRLLNFIENLANRFQLWYMQKPKGMERIEEGALYFHPHDCRMKILDKYNKRISRLSSGTP